MSVDYVELQKQRDILATAISSASPRTVGLYHIDTDPLLALVLTLDQMLDEQGAFDSSATE